jgi:hypothetical protein
LLKPVFEWGREETSFWNFYLLQGRLNFVINPLMAAGQNHSTKLVLSAAIHFWRNYLSQMEKQSV